MEFLSADLALDEALAAAVDLAHDAVATEVGADRVGGHLEVAMEDERLATHLFECLSPGYRGWRWAVTLARTPDSQDPTVCDVVLLPGPDALVAPAWVPWSERVLPGDLGVGDVFPTGAQDPRLVAGFTDEDDLEGIGSQSPLSPGTWEFGLGRARVLSQIGRDDAADRWYAGETGPDSAMAKNAPLTCLTCGFLLPMGGVFGQMFAVCANVMAPADGRVVALDYGCGAHSEVQVDEVLAEESVADEILDDIVDDGSLAESEGREGDRSAGDLESDAGAIPVDELVPDAMVRDDDLVEGATEDLVGTVLVDAAEVDILGDADDADDAGKLDEPAAPDEPTEASGAAGPASGAAGPAPKRPRGRGWLRGRSS